MLDIELEGLPSNGWNGKPHFIGFGPHACGYGALLASRGYLKLVCFQACLALWPELAWLAKRHY